MAKIARFPSRADEAAEAPLPTIEHALACARDGGRPQLHQFLLAIGPAVLGTVRRVLGAQHPDVEDVAQEACVQVLKALPAFRGECTARHFVVRVTTHCALAARRYQSYRDKWTPSADPHAIEEVAGGHHPGAWQQQFRLQQQREAVRELLQQLPSAQAETVVLYFLLGFTAEEVSRAMQVPVATVRSRINRARSALRTLVERTGRFESDERGPP